MTVGSYRVTDELLEIEYAADQPPVHLERPRPMTEPLPTERLDQFLAPILARERILELGRDAEWVLPVLIPAPLPGVEAIESAFYGLIQTPDEGLLFVRPSIEQEGETEHGGELRDLRDDDEG